MQSPSLTGLSGPETPEIYFKRANGFETVQNVFYFIFMYSTACTGTRPF
jgi:hypothetical protein